MIDASWWPYLMIIVAGWLATDIWRWIGVLAGGKLREDGELLIWVRCVATALVAGVIAKLILFPTGVLGETPMWLRVSAAAFGFLAFFASRQKVVVGVVAGEIALIAGWLLLGLPGTPQG
ncbi:AzlD domain-containing protein [Roseibium sp.]|uniref:AzlD domain-containing protein n=1 Tax=Roseibium sp. TaxID=1936156 RepID=UPI003A9882D7